MSIDEPSFTPDEEIKGKYEWYSGPYLKGLQPTMDYDNYVIYKSLPWYKKWLFVRGYKKMIKEISKEMELPK